VEELQAAILRSTADFDRVAWRPAVARALDKFLNIVDRRQAEFLAVGASSVTSLFGRHIKKQDPEVRVCYWFLKRIFPKLNEDQQQQVQGKLNDLLSAGYIVPCKEKYEAKLPGQVEQPYRATIPLTNAIVTNPLFCNNHPSCSA